MNLKEKTLNLVDEYQFTFLPEKCRERWYDTFTGETDLQYLMDLFILLESFNTCLHLPSVLSKEKYNNDGIIKIEDVYALLVMQEPLSNILDLVDKHIKFNDERCWYSLIRDAFHSFLLPKHIRNVVTDILNHYSDGTITFNEANQSFKTILSVSKDITVIGAMDALIECFNTTKRKRHLSRVSFTIH